MTQLYGSTVEDEEANVFAALMLMPPGQFEEAMKGVDPLDDSKGSSLAKVAYKFDVNIPIVLFRHWVVGPKLRTKRLR